MRYTKTIESAAAALMLFITLLTAVPTVAAADTTAQASSSLKRALYISSYSLSWGSVPSQIDGLSEGLGDNWVVNYEFMDTKNIVYSDDYREFYDFLKYKLEVSAPYDAVVVCDDAALNFIELYKDELFPNIPIVFSGVDNIENGIEAAKADNVTGIVEEVDYSTNMELAHAMFPKATKLVLILDNMENGIGIAAQLKSSSAAFADYQVEYLNSSDYTKDEMCKKLSEFDDSEIVFCISMGQQKGGEVYSEGESYAMIRDWASVPLFRFAQSGVGSGLLGGYLVDHEACCRTAGSLLNQMLSTGSSPEIVLDTPSVYYFDYNVMAKFGIKPSSLSPEIRDNCTIINNPESFIKKNAAKIICTLCVLLFLGCLYIMIARQKVYKDMQKKNIELADAVTQAHNASSAKSQFLARMSHEIRTPMNAIVGITAIAKHNSNDPVKVNDCLGKIESSSHVLLNLINDVLDMSAIENDKLKLNSAPFDISRVLNNISNIYYVQCRSKGVDFSMNIDISEEALIGDSLRVNQILLNLISNAYKFTSAGGKIIIDVRQIDQRDDTVFISFSVSDTGCGMDENMRSRLFKPFEQESAETAHKHGGSGLGLSIAKNLVEMMHGTINVQSQKNVGTEFTVTLPFAIDKSVRPETEAIKNLRILVVDDDGSAREYTGVILDRIGVRYDIAASGEAAIEIAKAAKADNQPYDICLVDWKMPEMSGVETTRELRSIFDKKSMIIIVSAYDLSEIEADAKAAGADMFVTKPLFQSTVFNLLMNLSGGRYTKSTATADSYDFTGCKLLLAEDNELNSEIAVELLGMVNAEVDCAQNGKIAVEKFTSAPAGTYDLILMDIQMPEMDGYEAAKAIRACDHPEAESIPILAMTANAFNEDIASAHAAGMNDHIAKPIDTAVLYSTLSKYLDKNK